MDGVTITWGTVLKGHCIRNIENHWSRTRGKLLPAHHTLVCTVTQSALHGQSQTLRLAGDIVCSLLSVIKLPCELSQARETQNSVMGSENLEVHNAKLNMGSKDCAHELSNGKLYQKLNQRQRAWCVLSISLKHE